MSPSPVMHRAGEGANKNPANSRRGFGISVCAKRAYRARHPELPGRGAFFEAIAACEMMTIRL
jgi:hypothetical protein